jgi:lysophospholipid acyltransferase (LPLAT)-like uncharacterized protein
VRKVSRKIGGVLLPVLAPGILRTLSSTWRVERLGAEHYDAWVAQPGRLGTLWHGRMLVALPAHRNTNLRVLVSPSQDGSLITMLLRSFGYGTVRGSSNKNPATAVRGMLTDLRQGGSIVITPDGPRGPRHSIHASTAWMARETGFPVLPCGFVCDRAWHFSSWDRFTIPKIGARIALVYGEPLSVDQDADDAEVQRATDEIKRRMVDAERRGFEHLGKAPDWDEEPDR